MYYQVFFFKSDSKIPAQVSCDTFQEVMIESEKRRCKKVRIDYYDSDGMVASIRKAINFFTGVYERYAIDYIRPDMAEKLK